MCNVVEAHCYTVDKGKIDVCCVQLTKDYEAPNILLQSSCY